MKISSHKAFIIDAYFNRNMSTVAIGKEIGASPKSVRDFILKQGYTLRDRKAAAKATYDNGRVPPMTGQTHSEDVRRKIATGVSNNWDALSEENYQKRVDKARETWYNLDVAVREIILSKARKALATVAIEGSKLEKEVFHHLTAAGYAVVMHYDKFPYEKLEVDLMLPGNMIAIEVDGPSHFLPLYGDERLKATIASDTKKNGLLLGLGYVVIRIGFVAEVTQFQTKDLIAKLFSLVEDITKNFPAEGHRYIELEIE